MRKLHRSLDNSHCNEGWKSFGERVQRLCSKHLPKSEREGQTSLGKWHLGWELERGWDKRSFEGRKAGLWPDSKEALFGDQSGSGIVSNSCGSGPYPTNKENIVRNFNMDHHAKTCIKTYVFSKGRWMRGLHSWATWENADLSATLSFTDSGTVIHSKAAESVVLNIGH